MVHKNPDMPVHIPPQCILHQKDITSLGTKIELLQANNKQNAESVEKICKKLEQTVNAMQEFVLNITQMITIHDEKIKQNESVVSDLLVTKSKEHIEFHQQIHINEDRIRKNEVSINKIETKATDAEKELWRKFTEITNKLDTLSTRLTKIEFWRWMIVGATLLLVFLVSNPFGIDKILHFLIGNGL